MFRGQKVHAEITRTKTKYSLADGEPIEIVHDGEKLTLAADKPLTRPMAAIPPRPRPSQPAGREPMRRRPTPDAT
jgi:alpha,alpha-trehalose phosphorylase